MRIPSVSGGGYLVTGQDLNLRPSGYEPDELSGCSTHEPYKGRPACGGWDSGSPQ